MCLRFSGPLSLFSYHHHHHHPGYYVMESFFAYTYIYYSVRVLCLCMFSIWYMAPLIVVHLFVYDTTIHFPHHRFDQ